MSRTKFLFHAGSAGLAGHIHRPFNQSLDVQAATALPPAGGRSTGCARDVNIRHFIHADSVTSCTVGSFNPASLTFETHVTCTVEGLRIGDRVVTVDMIHSELHSSVAANGSEPASIVPAGTRIVNLRIFDEPVELENLSHRFTELNTMDKLRETHRDRKDFRDWFHDLTMVERHRDLLDEKILRLFPFVRRERQAELHERDSVTVVPLFRVLTTSDRFEVIQNVICIPNFGRIQLGEMAVSPHQRQITGLYADLGSAVGGELSGASIYTNGTTCDPP